MTSSYEEIELQKTAEVARILEERHILDDEIKMVIDEAESTGEKLYRQAEEGERFLGKKEIGGATFYVEYSVVGEKTYKVHIAYAHRAKIIE